VKCFSETSVDFQWTMQQYIPESTTLQVYVRSQTLFSKTLRFYLSVLSFHRRGIPDTSRWYQEQCNGICQSVLSFHRRKVSGSWLDTNNKIMITSKVLGAFTAGKFQTVIHQSFYHLIFCSLDTDSIRKWTTKNTLHRCINFILLASQGKMLSGSMEQNPLWESNSYSASQEIPHVHKRPPLYHVLSKTNLVHILITFF
jgi:hypothetical protein